jgi:archaellum biogenesis ATPase FlaH
MASIKNLCQELDAILAGLNSSSFDKATPAVMENLEKISLEATEVGMKSGKGLIDNFIEVLKSFQAGKSNEDSVSLRLTALDFYVKNILGSDSDAEEEL